MACCCHFVVTNASLHRCVSVPGQAAGQQPRQSLPVSLADAVGLAMLLFGRESHCCTSQPAAIMAHWLLAQRGNHSCGCTAGHMTHWKRCLESGGRQGMAVCENGACTTGTSPSQRLACWTGQPFDKPSLQVSACVVLLSCWGSCKALNSVLNQCLH